MIRTCPAFLLCSSAFPLIIQTRVHSGLMTETSTVRQMKSEGLPVVERNTRVQDTPDTPGYTSITQENRNTTGSLFLSTKMDDLISVWDQNQIIIIVILVVSRRTFSFYPEIINVVVYSHLSCQHLASICGSALEWLRYLAYRTICVNIADSDSCYVKFHSPSWSSCFFFPAIFASSGLYF